MADIDDLIVDDLITDLENIVLVEALGFKKPEKAGNHCRLLAASAVEKIMERLRDDALSIDGDPDAEFRSRAAPASGRA